MEVELTRLIDQNTELRTQVAHWDHQRRAMPTDPTADPGPPRLVAARVTAPQLPPLTPPFSPEAEHDVGVADAVVAAPEQADQLTKQTHAKADQILSQARTQCQQLLTTAHDEAEDLLSAARARVKAILQGAQTAAQSLERRAQDQTASLEQDATRRRAEILDGLNRDKALLEKTLEEWRACELKYRRRLAAHLHALLHQLDEPAGPVPAAPLCAFPDRVAFRLDRRGQPVCRSMGDPIRQQQTGIAVDDYLDERIRESAERRYHEASRVSRVAG